jgi:2-polyprenyl-3-methyl-5-hydroxy-6-metoxy-1,4-benzoquinol methylase
VLYKHDSKREMNGLMQSDQASVVEQMRLGALEHTGERMVPEESHPGCFWEHIYRYRFATDFVGGKRVLDIACGEGYGTDALLKAGATSVIGMDISEEVCAHARNKYGIDARPGDAENIPLADQSVDVIVSFETVEHISSPAAFLDECVRVLAPGGLLIISTPNKKVFSGAGQHIEFHCSEMDEQEFVRLLTPRFKKLELYTQNPRTAALWSTRSLAAQQSLWFRVRGPGRLREVFRSSLCPHILGQLSSIQRQTPANVILSRDKPLSRLFNPYVLRKRSRWNREIPGYFVAVAAKYA